MGYVFFRWSFVCLSLILVTPAKGAITMASCGPAQISILKSDIAISCTCMERAYYAMLTYPKEIAQYFKGGANFPNFVRDPQFYVDRVANRVTHCRDSNISLSCAGLCASPLQRRAYVKVLPFGWVRQTIHICDEYFYDSSPSRVTNMSHEFGRLENIGDSEHFDTDNIYVWDNITGPLCDPRILTELKKLHDEAK